MSKIAITPNASGTGTFTIAAPAGSTDRTLTLPDAAGAVVIDEAGGGSVKIDSSGNVGIGTSSPAEKIHIDGGAAAGYLKATNNASTQGIEVGISAVGDGIINVQDAAALRLFTSDAERMRIDSAGRVTMAYQPSFHVSQDTGNVSAGNYYIFNVVRHNIGNHYSTSTGRFTAPVNGVYHFSFSNIADNNTAQNEWFLYKNGGRFLDTRDDTQNGRYQTLAASVTTYLSAGDWVALYVDAGQMYGGVSSWTHFSGHLVG